MKEIFKTFKEEDFFKNVNLHIHSNLSDGKSSVEEIYEKFKNFKDTIRQISYEFPQKTWAFY